MQHETNRVLFAYWDQLRNGRIAPKRNEIDPARISTILPQVMMLDCQTPGNYCFRIAGTKLCRYFDAELRGYNFLNLWHPFDRKSMRDKLAAISEHGNPATFDVQSHNTFGETVFSELLILPLTRPDGKIYRLLGAWSLTEDFSWRNATPLSKHSLVETGQTPRLHTLTDRIFTPLDQVKDTGIHLHNEHQTNSPKRRFRVYDGGRP